MILDFKEIPEANGGSGLQDTFELFAREFLMFKGYNIIENPDRGADGQRDLIVEEVKRGISADVSVKWLVSCKHFAHSGRAVKDSDEINILERLSQHNCDGFMGIYSTLPATSLAGKVNSLGNRAFVYDHEALEREILSNVGGETLAARFFPESYKRFVLANPERADIINVKNPIRCERCGKLLVARNVLGNYITLFKGSVDEVDYDRIDKIAFCCKECDDYVTAKYDRLGYYNTGWDDISDLLIPTTWLAKNMAFMNSARKGNSMSEEAFDEVKRMLIESYPYVARQLTTTEQKLISSYITHDVI